MRQNANKGFTLIELMIAMVLGLLIIGGLYGAYLAVSDSNRQRAAYERASSVGLFTFESIAGRVRMSGFGIAGAGIVGEADELTVSYFFETTVPGVMPGRNCLGQPLDVDDDIVTDRFYIQDGALFCDSTILGVTQTQRMTGSISALEISYRYDNGTSAGWHADTPSDPAHWESVSAIRLRSTINAAPLADRVVSQTISLRNRS